MSKLLDEIKQDVIDTKADVHDAADGIENSVFELCQLTLDELLDTAIDTDDLLNDIKRQRRDFNNKLKVFEASMKKLRDFF